jgi:hypothetical protein
MDGLVDVADGRRMEGSRIEDGKFWAGEDRGMAEGGEIFL